MLNNFFHSIYYSILGNRGPNLVGKGKYKVCMWERLQTKTNLLHLVPQTVVVVVAPAACGQWDPCLNMAGNSSPSTPPPHLFPSFWGPMAQRTNKATSMAPTRIEKLFLLVKKITRTPGHAQTMPKSPQYLPMPTTGCRVQEVALQSQ